MSGTQMKLLFMSVALCALLMATVSNAADRQAPVSVVADRASGGLAVVLNGRPARVIVDQADLPAVVRAAEDLSADLKKLAGGAEPAEGPIILVGTIGASADIDRLIATGKLDVSGVKDQWEAYVQQVVDNPMPGVARAMVIAGADRRGTIFGIYDLSERAGVSPWAWWADVPIVARKQVFVTAGRRVDRPTVKYRGIFINDEDPAFSSWSKATFGGVNHKVYERVFELVLRMKGNYIWPAMWGKSLFEDDPESIAVADRYGVVLGTSHHEPMMRAQSDWKRAGGGAWDYTKNAPALQAFWRDGVKRMAGKEGVFTIGMRGDGDEPMTEGTATQLLETIVGDQRKIIGEVTGKDPANTPQVWALYKEVQDYHDAGMKVPDDVMLLFSDDNWGNIRRLPQPGVKRAGGYGVYYHFDYVGGPRSYRWLNTNQIERTWEQMKLASDYGADQLWIVNVGDLKPMELPTEFFLDMAWNPAAMTLERMDNYAVDWARAQFGDKYAPEIGELLEGYTRFNARRKPELLTPETFSLVNEREAERVVAEWDDLEARTLSVGAKLPSTALDAYFQLVQFPIQASANLTRMYVAVGRNRLYAAQGRASAARWGETAKTLFARDAELTRQFHQELAGGKWTGMMSQVHIGYSSWNAPVANIMPSLAEPSAAGGKGLGVAVEGGSKAARAGESLTLPVLDADGPPSRWIDVFSGGKPSAFTASSNQPWLKVSPAAGRTNKDTRLEVSVDWKAAPAGRGEGHVRILSEEGETVLVTVPVYKPDHPRKGYVETGGQLAIEAAHVTKVTGREGVEWREIPGLGRTVSGMASYPSTAPASAIGEGATLEYAIDLADKGAVDVWVIAAPSLDFRGKDGLSFGVSFDDAPPRIGTLALRVDYQAWSQAVASNAAFGKVRFTLGKGGARTLKIWRMDPGVVIEKVVISRGGLTQTFLGPRESTRR
jgi:hypothetical protein